MRRVIALAALVLLSLTLACGDGGPSTPAATPADGEPLPTAALTILSAGGGHAELTVEIAKSAAERSRGLMFREELAEDGGMLFVFGRETQAGFWMQNTLIPLSIAFIAADGTILDIQEMEPQTTESHRPPVPYRYALEVNQGWFGDSGIAVGDRVEIPPEAGAE